jgi:hypothetical protein
MLTLIIPNTVMLHVFVLNVVTLIGVMIRVFTLRAF